MTGELAAGANRAKSPTISILILIRVIFSPCYSYVTFLLKEARRGVEDLILSVVVS